MKKIDETGYFSLEWQANHDGFERLNTRTWLGGEDVFQEALEFANSIDGADVALVTSPDGVWVYTWLETTDEWLERYTEWKETE